ncbi:serine/threonine-protein kinase MHK isoform X3 [Cornus florida]|uniref:serine/threonine-protein kinase MHK isoform X3 n=1 Tax=Cornus florida TaxID=4283 RepID=UPI0028A2274E|nr:serine/threonine-protein kinase MHK isoform X3 [Cornus florida]
MERYRILEELGDGTCGSVYKAINIETSEIVAVKKMKRKFYYWEECMNLREVKSLRKLNHPNIIKLKEIVREHNELFFIFEYMEYNLYQIMRERQRHFPEEEIRGFMSQLLQGLSHMHKNGYFHRDLKPENLLVTNDIIKIADFGLAREVSSMPPFTDYVSTRWYRAPEVLLQSSSYTPAIDMWAVGAILAELFTLCPIFPGESETDQLYKICCVLGTPNWTTFPPVRNITQLINISYSEIVPANLSDIIPNASLEAIDLIKQLCSWDPQRRPTADQCLQHPFFHVPMLVPRPLGDPLQLKLSDMDMIHKVSTGTAEDILFCSGFQDHPQQSVFWSLLAPDHNRITTPVDSSLSLSFSPTPHSTIGVQQSTGFSIASLQPNILDRSFLAMSSPFQQGHCL